MPIVAEQTFRFIHDALDYTTATWEVNMSPSNVFAKVALTEYNEYAVRDTTYAGLNIRSVMRRRSDGLIEWVYNNTNAAYDPQMTNITIWFYGLSTISFGILVIEYWG